MTDLRPTIVDAILDRLYHRAHRITLKASPYAAPVARKRALRFNVTEHVHPCFAGHNKSK